MIVLASSIGLGVLSLSSGRAIRAVVHAAQTSETSRKTVDFVKDIQPIFKASCHQCHGPEMQMGQLRLDSKALALQGGISGRVIVPGKSRESLLLQRVSGKGDKARMPLQGDPLPENQMALIGAWIEQGADWPDEASATDAAIAKHWAYVKPVRPPLPSFLPSASKGGPGGEWVRNPIDTFVQARLEKEELSPSPEASRENLIRRVSLDLIGLPPTPEEVDAFAADHGPEAYENVVDRLLASPHYGERWARPWLDMARYADTNGYEADRRRPIWKYRDWLINALNQDMPFDQFTVEQIAGDMLANATPGQKIATGFHRNTMHNEEGGVDRDEARWLSIIDRVGTTASVWLGTTLACAQCHNHKYDPFTQKDFYRFFAFFDNTEYDLKDSDIMRAEPVLELPTPEQEAERRNLQGEIAQLQGRLQTQTAELDKEQAQWERGQVVAGTVWKVLDPAELKSENSSLKKSDDKSILANPYQSKDTYVMVARTNLQGITAFQLEVLPDKSLPAYGPGRDKDGNFLLSAFRVETSSSKDEKTAKRVELHKAQADFSQENFAVIDLLDENPDTGWAIAPQTGQAHYAVFEIKTPVGDSEETTLIFKLEHQSQKDKALLGRFRLSVTTERNPSPAPPVPDSIRVVLDTPPDQRTEQQRAELSVHYRSISPSLKPAKERLSQLTQRLQALEIVSTLVMRERSSFERPSTLLRVKGSYLNKGEKVYASVPVALHPLPQEVLPNRLGLAHWLIDENNPLVARVTVNRFWEEYFGRGIVETAEDFGTRGDRPTHPELLDWLASEFMRQGWSMKSVHRLIATSATYRQSSRTTPALRERDPANRLLARGPRFRLEAEMLRDVALSASGLLNRRTGGPSVFPFQPDGIWDLPYNDDKWILSNGTDRYRRGLYTFSRRTAPYPSFMNFDASSREFCTVRRIRTNTPLQALTALNDPAFFDPARALARRMTAEAGPDVQARALHGFRLCVSRPPKPEELQRLTALYQRELEHYRRDEKAAEKLIGGCHSASESFQAPELAAWTVVANVLLNLDQTLTKE